AISPASPDRRNYAVHVAAVAPQPRGAVLALTINDLHHWEGEARPEIPLEARITEHLDLQTQIWAHDARQRLGETIEDLDDDVPF
ncbi:hypothetical protein ACQKOH_03660, partial [Sphingomonas sp. NPDC092331]|uniref:hypothetical protein n=1 Tax=unclassified Sphingomonas TaxID=196159 RepID=UPI0038229310